MTLAFQTIIFPPYSFDMGDDALLLALDDGDMDFGDVNCDLLDEDDDVDVTEPVDNKQVSSQSQGDDLRQKVELKKIR